MPAHPANDCLFCRIVQREVPATVVHEDALCIAFEDIRPQAPTHLLVVPRTHIATLDEAAPEHEPLLGHLLTVAARLARARGTATAGYRTVVNCNGAAGQTVFHIHVHLLGGRSFGWPPG